MIFQPIPVIHTALAITLPDLPTMLPEVHDYLGDVLGVGVLLAKLGFVLWGLFTVAAYMVLLERRLLGRFQLRLGPNRAGPFGLLQPLADAVKLLLKEDLVPAQADRTIFLLAPALTALSPLLAFAVVPFGNDLTILGHRVPMLVTDLNVGLLAVLALSSISVYGVALGGWASRSKYSFIGAVRGVAQMISYELPLVLALVPVVMLAGSFSLVDIVDAQARYPFVLVQPVGFVLFLICAMAETRRVPFDLPEAENELLAGYHTEYSGMRFGLYYLGEYVNMIALGGLIAVFYLGGWRGPLLPAPVWFLLKVMILPLFLIWTRATLPRLRYDQLLRFCWRVLIPLALVNILATAVIVLLVQ